jgi:type I restriction enzyme S subunit
MSLTGNVGRICHVIGDNFLLNQRVAKLRSKIYNSSQFIYYTFRNRSMVQLIENLSLGSTAQMNLSPIQLGKQKIIVPDQELLNKFEDIVLPVKDEKIFFLKSTEKLRNIRDGLLSRLMSGKIDVENLDIQFPKSMLEQSGAEEQEENKK